MKFFLDKFAKGPLAAVDFDSGFLRIVQVQRAVTGVRIIRLAQVGMPDGIDTSDPRAVGEFLAATFKEMKIAPGGILMDVPRGQAVLKTLALPAKGDDELAAMVRFGVEKELPFRPEEAVIDFAVESHTGSTGPSAAGFSDKAATSVPPEGAANPSSANSAATSVLVAAVRLPVVDYYRQVALHAGVKLLRLGLRPYSNMRCLDACGALKDRGPTALVVVDADQTEIDVFSGEATAAGREAAMAFSRSAVIKIPPLSRQIAESDEGVETPMSGVADQTSQSVQGVVAEVIRSLGSFQAAPGGMAVESVLVAGGTGLEGSIVADLQRRLGINCRLFNPAGPLKLFDNGNTGAFTSALGLAIGSGDAGGPFNFLSPKRPVVKRDMRKIRIAAIASAVAVVLVGAIAARGFYLGQKQHIVDELTGSYQTLKKKDAELKAAEKEALALKNWAASRRNWLDHWANLSVLFPPCQDAYITALRTEDNGIVKFTVRAKDDSAVRQIDESLTRCGYLVVPASNPPDPLGYTFSNFLQVQLTPAVVVDLSTTQPARPADDASDDPTYKAPGNRPKPTPTPVVKKPGPPEKPEATPSPAPTKPPRGKNSSRPRPDSSGRQP